MTSILLARQAHTVTLSTVGNNFATVATATISGRKFESETCSFGSEQAATHSLLSAVLSVHPTAELDSDHTDCWLESIGDWTRADVRAAMAASRASAEEWLRGRLSGRNLEHNVTGLASELEEA